VIALLAALGIALAIQPDTASTPRAGIRMVLPERVGAYEGVDLRFCQNELCPASFTGATLSGTNACPVCGGKMAALSIAESKVLPPDTTVVRKRYTPPSGPAITVAIVLSGTEQRSIHRPQQCLPAQGVTIERSRTISVPLPGRAPLKVMLLETRDPRTQASSAYAYWFVGLNRETPYHLQRLLWMASDRVLHNLSHRWAYVSLAVSGGGGNAEDQVRRITQFIAVFYPLIKAGD
jgi:hypothetical protein